MLKGIKKLIVSLIITNTVLTMTTFNVFASTTPVSTFDDFKEEVINHLENREASFSISYRGNPKEFFSQADNLIFKASDTKEYLDLSLLHEKYIATNKNGLLTVTINASYITDKAQEDFIEEKTSEIVSTVVTSDMTVLQKVKSLHDYVCENVSYDKTLSKLSAYTALKDGKTVCRGYALLLNKLFIKAGIPTRIVVGKLLGQGHAWNMVEINDNWYHIDGTNNDSTNSNKYFCVSDNLLIKHGFTWNRIIYPVAGKDLDSGTLLLLTSTPKNVINTEKNRLPYDKRLKNATNMVTAAEIYKSTPLATTAEKIVAQLKDQDKAALMERLQAVNRSIQSYNYK